jgi:hypothetical protein
VNNQTPTLSYYATAAGYYGRYVAAKSSDQAAEKYASCIRRKTGAFFPARDEISVSQARLPAGIVPLN